MSWSAAPYTCTYLNDEWLPNVSLWSTPHTTAPVYSLHNIVGHPAFYLNAISVDGAGNPGGALSYLSSDTSVVTVDETGVVTVVGAGYAQILITADATEYADPVTIAVSVMVTQPAPPSQPEEGEGGGLGEIIEDILNFGNQH